MTIAPIRPLVVLLSLGKRERDREAHADLAGDDQIDAGIELGRGHFGIEEVLLLQLLELDPMLVILRIAEIASRR